jgi:hypothetical protein
MVLPRLLLGGTEENQENPQNNRSPDRDLNSEPQENTPGYKPFSSDFYKMHDLIRVRRKSDAVWVPNIAVPAWNFILCWF